MTITQVCKLLSVACATVLLAPALAAAGDVAAGKSSFVASCASCHGETGKGDGPVGAVLDPRPRDFSTAEFKFDTDGDGEPGSDDDLKNVIAKGAAAYGGSPLMAPWPTLSEEDIANIVVYIRSLQQ